MAEKTETPPQSDNPPKSADLVKESADLNRRLSELQKEMQKRNESSDSILAALTKEFDEFKAKHGTPPTPPKPPDQAADFWGWFKIPGV
jgi:hypothetical protein